MIFAIDAGNTHIVLGCMEGSSLLFTARVHTDRAKTADEYALIFRNLCDLHQIDRQRVEGAILSCVVSELTLSLCRAIEIVIHQKPLVVGAGIKTGLNIKIDNPAQLGADLVVGAVAALAKHPKSFLIWGPPTPCRSLTARDSSWGVPSWRDFVCRWTACPPAQANSPASSWPPRPS